MELYIWLLVWLACTLPLMLLLLLCGLWQRFHIHRSEYVSDISWRVSNLFITVTVYLLLISQLVFEDQSYRLVLIFISYFWVDSGVSLLWGFYDWKILLQKRSIPHSSKRYLSISCLWVYNLAVLKDYLGWCRSLVFPPFILENSITTYQSAYEWKVCQKFPHFCLMSCVSRICYFRLCLFVRWYLHRWLKCYVLEYVEKGKINPS